MRILTNPCFTANPSVHILPSTFQLHHPLPGPHPPPVLRLHSLLHLRLPIQSRWTHHPPTSTATLTLISTRRAYLFIPILYVTFYTCKPANLTSPTQKLRSTRSRTFKTIPYNNAHGPHIKIKHPPPHNPPRRPCHTPHPRHLIYSTRPPSHRRTHRRVCWAAHLAWIIFRWVRHVGSAFLVCG